MRGTILHFDDTIGEGVISAEDGYRYSFSRYDISSATPAYPGMPVDFIPDDRSATQIFALPQEAEKPFFTAPASFESGAADPELSLFDYAKRAVTRDYAKFSGRARRKEYWGFVLFSTLASGALIVLMLLATLVSVDLSIKDAPPSPLVWVVIVAFFVLAIGLVVPSIAITFRRLHDIGQSGWLYPLLVVLGAIPVIGFVAGIALLVMMCLDGQPVPNAYGIPAKTARSFTPR